MSDICNQRITLTIQKKTVCSSVWKQRKTSVELQVQLTAPAQIFVTKYSRLLKMSDEASPKQLPFPTCMPQWTTKH